MNIETLMEAQRDLESDGLAEGKRKFEKALQDSIDNGTYADRGAARKLLQHGLQKFTEILEDLLSARGVGRPNIALQWIEKVGPEKAAYIAVRCCFQGAMKRETVPHVSLSISKRITDELRFRRLEAEHPELFKYRLSNFATNHYIYRSRSLDQAIRYAEVDTSDLELSNVEGQHVGAYLISRLIEATGLFELERVRERKKERIHLVPTPETMEWLTKRNSIMALMQPAWPCMVVQPLPWGKNQKGGYRFGLRGSAKLVRRASKAHQKLLDEADMEPVYKALNLIQNTEWQVNTQVLEVLSKLLDEGGGRANLPSAEPIPPIPRPVWLPERWDKGNDGWKEDPEKKEEFRRWKRREFHRNSLDVKRNMEHIKLLRLREAAEKYAKYDAIYFPHSLDFRGRMYPIPTALNPQGDDFNKALLKFAVGKPLGRSGAKYLAIHGANLWGKDKSGTKTSRLTLEERVALIEDNSDEIRSYAQAPLENTGWMDADEPWCFLAFCFEWNEMCSFKGPREEFVGKLPVSTDGTCNGLQHYAALLRDPVAGAAVNVLANSRPKDIYQEVAEAVLKLLEKEASDNPIAALWLNSGLVNRSLTKRPTMTLAYGATQFGFKDQLVAYLLKDVDKDKLKVFYKWDDRLGDYKLDLHDECVYMARLIWEALGDVVVSAQKGMQFFQKYARAAAKANKNPTWVVPGTGFMVYQDCFKWHSKQIKTVLCGQLYYPRLNTKTDNVDPVAAANGIAPNVIHSLDAAALALTVIRASDSGVTHFAFVHDSYGTHAGDAEVLNYELRQAFFGLYKQDVVGDLADQFRHQIEMYNKERAEEDPKAKLLGLPKVPPKGNLDLSQVLVSDYFFC